MTIRTAPNRFLAMPWQSLIFADLLARQAVEGIDRPVTFEERRAAWYRTKEWLETPKPWSDIFGQDIRR